MTESCFKQLGNILIGSAMLSKQFVSSKTTHLSTQITEESSAVVSLATLTSFIDRVQTKLQQEIMKGSISAALLQSRLIPPGARARSRRCSPSVWAETAGPAAGRSGLSWKQTKRWMQHSVEQKPTEEVQASYAFVIMI